MSKFCYEEGELQFADNQCQLCVRYNGGERSEECPKEELEKIINNEILCPMLNQGSIFDKK